MMFKITIFALSVLAMFLGREILDKAASRSPKAVAQQVLDKQFPGWCDWSSALMIDHPNGDVFVRCIRGRPDGDFGVDTKRRIATRLN